MAVRQKPFPITAPSRPQRGGRGEEVTVNKNPQGPVRVLGVATAEFLL